MCEFDDTVIPIHIDREKGTNQSYRNVKGLMYHTMFSSNLGFSMNSQFYIHVKKRKLEQVFGKDPKHHSPKASHIEMI